MSSWMEVELHEFPAERSSCLAVENLIKYCHMRTSWKGSLDNLHNSFIKLSIKGDSLGVKPLDTPAYPWTTQLIYEIT